MRLRAGVLNATISIGVVLMCAGCGANSSINVENSIPSQLVIGSGKETSEVRMVSDEFTGIQATWGQDVVVHAGKPQQVRVIGDDNVVEFVKTEVAGHSLHISMPGAFQNIHCRVEIDTPKISAVANTGSGNITADGVRTDSFDIADDGSGSVTVSGAARDLHAMVTGSGMVDASKLVCEGANVLVQGSGSLKIAPTKELNAALQGSGAVICTGHPAKVQKAVQGSGNVVFR